MKDNYIKELEQMYQQLLTHPYQIGDRNWAYGYIISDFVRLFTQHNNSDVVLMQKIQQLDIGLQHIDFSDQDGKSIGYNGIISDMRELLDKLKD